MLQTGEDLALTAEALHRLGARDLFAHDLEGDPLLELTIRSLGQIDDPHPAVTERAHRSVGPDLAATLDRQRLRARAVAQQPIGHP